jgi:catechol 2,3-dioxygenase-like lactoylglutathione lyase family enzyme
MLDHVELNTQRLSDCVEFYKAVLEPMGYRLVQDGVKKGFRQGDRVDFWLSPGEPSRDVHFAFTAADREAVNQAYTRAGSHGSRRDRAPALLPDAHPSYYAGFARDPDGRLVEFVSHSEE